jgi:2-oxo-4-hydroxy-4-carboxy-5-ureidoimidazoline decarboxylase
VRSECLKSLDDLVSKAMAKIHLDRLLSLPPAEFVSHIGGIYEKSPWIVEEFYNSTLSSTSLEQSVVHANRGRITNVKILFDEIRQRVANGGLERQMELLRHHPDLCLKFDMSDAVDITEESRIEQGRSGLSTLTPDELAKFRDLNGRYRTKFQFPFILAVRNASKHTVLSALDGRVNSSIEDEISCALHQVDKIAWMRLLTLVDHPEGSDGHGGFLTCHVLDTANGIPASGMRIDLYTYDDDCTDGERVPKMKSFVTNADGRLTGGPALSGSDFRIGRYEWMFHVGDYFAKYSSSRISGTPFLDVVPLRFGLDDPTEHYHVPLLVSPWSYSTYRGS